MNMKSYQEFVRIYDFINRTNSDAMIDESIRRRMVLLKKKYAKTGVDDEETIRLIERRKTNQNNREVSLFLSTAQVFELDDKHKYLLMLTNNPKLEDKELWEQVRLPFPEMFIDVEFDAEDLETSGTDIAKIHGVLLKEMKKIGAVFDVDKKNISKSQIYGLTAYIVGVTVDGNPFLDKINTPIHTDVENYMVIHENKKESEFIKKFIVNFLLFLKDREVVYVESHRSAKNQERRVKEGKMLLPSSKIIKLTGELKRYVDSVQENEFRGKLGYQFWVRGFWRTYRSARYKNVKDKVQWIEPFRKGQGIEVKHVYRVLPKEDDDVLDYDDIEPAKEMRR